MQWSHSARLGLWEDSRPLMNVESVRPLAGMQACEQPRVGTEAAADSLLLVPAGQEGLGMAEEAAWARGPVPSTCSTFASCCHRRGPALFHWLRTPGPGGVAKTRTNSCIPHPEDHLPWPSLGFQGATALFWPQGG